VSPGLEKKKKEKNIDAKCMNALFETHKNFIFYFSPIVLYKSWLGDDRKGNCQLLFF
jgi:hypothetical protein